MTAFSTVADSRLASFRGFWPTSKALSKSGVSGRRLFETKPAHSVRSLTMLVHKTCVDATCQGLTEKIEVCEKTGNSWTKIMFGVSQNSHKAGSQPMRPESGETSSSPLLRKLVYDAKAQYFGVLNKEAKFRAKCLAHRMVKWLLGIPVEPFPNTSLLAFRTLHNNEIDHHPVEGAQTRIGDLLRRWPRSAHPEIEDEDDKSVIQRLVSVKKLELDDSQTDRMSFEQILREFPAVVDYLLSFKKKCACVGCELERSSVDFCQHGCLRRNASDYLFLLIGNSIADGFGVDNVSGMLQVEQYLDQVRKLLSQLLHGLVLWNTWFNLAAYTTLGYHPRLFRESSPMVPHGAEAGSALVAVQYGSLVAAASWTDLTSELKVRGCFKLDVALGSMRGVMDEQAFAESELTMQLMDMSEPSVPTEVTADPDGDTALRRDKSSFKIDNAIVSTEYNYRLLTIASTENYQRFVDPALAILCLAQSPEVRCLHTSASPSTAPIDRHIRFQTLDAIFGTWDLVPDAGADTPPVNYTEPITTTYILDEYIKFNSILCLCPDGAF